MLIKIFYQNQWTGASKTIKKEKNLAMVAQQYKRLIKQVQVAVKSLKPRFKSCLGLTHIFENVKMKSRKIIFSPGIDQQLGVN